MSKTPELLNPAQVCKTLGITPAGIKRLTKDGHLEIKASVSFKNGDMPLFRSEQVYSLIPKIPRVKQTWEREDKNRFGSSRVAFAKVNRQKAYWKKRLHKQQFMHMLADQPPEIRELMRASYFLFHLNHYAKANSPYLYDLKENVLEIFAREYYGRTGILQVNFIEGDNKTILCQDCKAKAKKQSVSYVDYIYRKGGCPKCTREFKYYSLYEFLVTLEEYRFSFHTPYNTGKRWFKNAKVQPPYKQRFGPEGAYIFGRTIFESEARVVDLSEAIEQLQDFLAAHGFAPVIETNL